MSWITSFMGYPEKSDSNAPQKEGTKATASPAAPAPSAAKDPNEPFWGDSAWAKAVGLAPWARFLEGPKDPMSGKQTMQSIDEHLRLTGYGRWDRPTGGATIDEFKAGHSDMRKNQIVGDKKVTGFGLDEKGGFKTPEYNKWSAKGKTYGNRESDVVNSELQRKQKVSAAPTVWQPKLDKIGNGDPTKPGYDPRSSGHNDKSGVLDRGAAAEKAKADNADYNDSGSFRASKYGSYSGRTGMDSRKWDPVKKEMVWDPNAKFTTTHSGKGSMGITGWEGQWGAEEKGGWRATHASKDGNTTAAAEAGVEASGGANGSYGLDTSKGAFIQGGIAGRIGAFAQADVDKKMEMGKLGGVDYNWGLGAHGEVHAGAKGGASGSLAIGPEHTGAKFDIGAFFGAELAGDLHGNLGPVSGRLNGSLMAGAGAGVDGDISYKDGKFHVGGKMFAGVGVGGSLGGDLTVDVGAVTRSAQGIGSDAADGMGIMVDDMASVGSSALSSLGVSDAVDGIESTASDVYDYGASALSSVLSW